MSSEKPLYYWDACMFLERIRRENVTPEKAKARDLILEDNKSNKNLIITSVITHAEALPKKLNFQNSDAEKEYLSLFDARKIVDVEIDRNTIALARHIRDFYYRPKDDDPGVYWVMDTGDAIHLATAIKSNVDEFHTRDNKKKKGNVPLLDLHKLTETGKICDQWVLTILSPQTKQGELALGH